MKRWLSRTLMLTGPLTLAGIIIPAATVPAGASPPPGQNLAAGSITSTAPHRNGLAVGPPASTTVVDNVNIPGLLSTGLTTDTAGTSGAYSKVTNVSASTSWSAGPTTYTLRLTANQVVSYCTANPLTSSGNIVKGVLTETAHTGSSTSTQVVNLPQLPATDQSYSYHGATVSLGFRPPNPDTLLTGGIDVQTPDQQLDIAITGCARP
jgi:hypothetical protein